MYAITGAQSAIAGAQTHHRSELQLQELSDNLAASSAFSPVRNPICFVARERRLLPGGGDPQTCPGSSASRRKTLSCLLQHRAALVQTV